LLSVFFLLTGVILADNYRPPNMEKELFSTKKLAINDITKTALFAGLLSVARDFDEKEDEANFELRSNSLAIAGRLEPKSENFKDVLDDLKQRSRTVKQDAAKSDIYSKIYRGVRTLMRKDENKDNLKCAAYCIDIALRFEPEGKYQDTLEKYQKKTGKADWKDMLKAPVFNNPWDRQDDNEFKERRETIPGGEAEKFAATQRTVYGLSVRTLSNGRHAGAAASLSATALREKDIDGIEFHIDQKVGNMTGNSLEEIMKLMRVRHEDDGRIPSGYRVTITFEDKDTLLDGPSAGTAMSIILDSLFTGRELDDKFACTGAITADGKVTRIGGVAGKIRGATNKGCNLVGVPHENIKGVSDILVLDGIKKLMAIQVFSFKTLEEALMVASKDKPEDVQSTIDDFNKVAELIEAQGEESLKNAKVIELLEDVVKKMPNHESAKILLSVAKGEEKKILSLGGSFHQINTNISGVARKIQMMVWSDEADLNSADRNAAKDALNELEGVSDKLDSRLKGFSDSMLKVLKSFSEGREDDEKDEEFIERIKKEWETANGERSKLMGDPEIMEELYG
ncbi:MAG: S16 family serine protease, partial [Akkermansiaceae bacterium]